MERLEACARCGRKPTVASGSERPFDGGLDLRYEHDIKECFHELDKNGDGAITSAEFKDVLQRLPLPAGKKPFSDADCKSTYEHIDEDNDGFVDYQEFADWVRRSYPRGTCQDGQQRAGGKRQDGVSQRRSFCDTRLPSLLTSGSGRSRVASSGAARAKRLDSNAPRFERLPKLVRDAFAVRALCGAPERCLCG